MYFVFIPIESFILIVVQKSIITRLLILRFLTIVKFCEANISDKYIG
jgi:hypothetical protein